MRGSVLLAITVAVAAEASLSKSHGRDIPDDLYRDNVEPSKGGKVPEAAHMRVELNKLDAAGLESGEGIRMMEELLTHSITLPDRSGSNYNPGYSPPLKLKPDYALPRPSYDPSASVPSSYAPAPAAYGQGPPPPSYGPGKSDYAPPAADYAPAPATGGYAPAEPAYHAPAAPVGPVLLHKRPYEVTAVQPLPITVEETYTTFDCRSVPYPDRHYADPEAGCEVYHFCHKDGKQDSFKCGYGTVFNEYIGTCDYKNNVHCAAGTGAAAAAAAKHQLAPYHATVPPHHAAPRPYDEPYGF